MLEQVALQVERLDVGTEVGVKGEFCEVALAEVEVGQVGLPILVPVEVGGREVLDGVVVEDEGLQFGQVLDVFRQLGQLVVGHIHFLQVRALAEMLHLLQTAPLQFETLQALETAERGWDAADLEVAEYYLLQKLQLAELLQDYTEVDLALFAFVFHH